MERGYTFMMVDLRGFGGSTGCLDWGGPGEQSDVVNAVEWAAHAAVVDRQGRHVRQVLRRRDRADRRRQARPPGLAAVVSQEPVYDLYRYLYGDGMRRTNAFLTPALYDLIDATPGPIPDDPNYNVERRQRHPAPRLPGRQLRRPGRQRRPRLGVLEGAEPDPGRHGLRRAAVPHPGADREQHGRRRHRAVPAEPHRLRARLARPVGARARQRDRRERPPEDGPRRLVRRGHALLRPASSRASTPTVADPPIAVQTNDGKWRAEQSWPPADASGVHDPAALRHLHRRRHRQRDRRRRGDGRLDDLAAAARTPSTCRAPGPRDGRRDHDAAQRQPRARRLRPRRERHRPADHAPGPPDPQVGDGRPRPVVGGLEGPAPATASASRSPTPTATGGCTCRPSRRSRSSGGSISLPFLPAARDDRDDPGRPGHAAGRLPAGDRHRAGRRRSTARRRRGSRRPRGALGERLEDPGATSASASVSGPGYSRGRGTKAVRSPHAAAASRSPPWAATIIASPGSSPSAATLARRRAGRACRRGRSRRRGSRPTAGRHGGRG